MKVWVSYSVTGWVDSDEYKDEVDFRTGLLGPNHWSAISSNGPRRVISLHIEEDLALLFALKYQNCQLTKEVGSK